MSFIEQSNRVHNYNYDYSLVDYKNRRTPVIIICKIHGKFEQQPRRHLEGNGCPKCGIIKCTKSISRSTDEFITLAKNKHGEKYDYSLVNYINEKTNVIIICKTHGNFEQKPSVHLSKHKNGDCPKCSSKMISENLSIGYEQFVSECNKLYDGYFKYDELQYKNLNEKIIITCQKHGNFEQIAKSHLNGHIGCKECYNFESGPQQKLRSILELHGYNIITNTRELIKPYEIDIYLPDYRLGIECNGVYYHSYNYNETTKERNRHQDKTIVSQANNIQLLQFTDIEINTRLNLILSMIKSKTGKSDRIYARNCVIEQIDSSQTQSFLNQNHMNGYRAAKITICLKHNNKIVGILSLSKHHQYEWEIIRSAYDINTIVIGGFNKMFEFFKKKYNPQSVMTYADKRFSDGKSYIKSCFKIIKITKPNYSYYKSDIIYSRQQFQKHKLYKKLKIYNELESESENMFNNGYRRLWDAGHIKLLWNP